MKTVIRNVTIIDSVDPIPKPNSAVIIRNGRIQEICENNDSLTAHVDAHHIDGEQRYLLPGLWDAHVHPDYHSPDDMPLPDQVTLFGHRLRSALLESGMVGFRCAGSHSYMDVAWRRAFESSQYVGPHLF